MKTFRPFCNKRGIAIETAIYMMFIITALCLLLTTILFTSNMQAKKTTKDFAEKLTVNAVGEDLLFALNAGDLYRENGEWVLTCSAENNENKYNYGYALSSDTLTVRESAEEGAQVLLTATLTLSVTESDRTEIIGFTLTTEEDKQLLSFTVTKPTGETLYAVTKWN